jgi:hypothetical protein
MIGNVAAPTRSVHRNFARCNHMGLLPPRPRVNT